MAFLKPLTPPFKPSEWAQLPFQDRARLACESYAVQGWGFPGAVYFFYAAKIVLYMAGWLAFLSFTPGMGFGHLDTFGDWWLSGIAFQKAVLWSMLFEGLGLGCGSGPLTARYFPPFTAFLHFLRPGTTKRPMFAEPARPRRLPAHAGSTSRSTPRRRCSWSRAREQRVPDGLLIAIAAATSCSRCATRRSSSASRGEHYWTMIVVFVLASNWIPAAKAV